MAGEDDDERMEWWQLRVEASRSHAIMNQLN